MQLNLEKNNGIFVHSFSAGELRVNDRIITGPVILTPDAIIEDWAPPDVGALSIADFAAALAIRPEVLLLGTGARQTFPPTALLVEIMRDGTGVEVMATGAACRTFNVLVAEGRRVAAALLL